MKKYFVATALVFAFVSPALAEQFYVVFDPASKRCEAMHNIPTGMKSDGHLWQHGRSQEGHGQHERVRLGRD